MGMIGVSASASERTKCASEHERGTVRAVCVHVHVHVHASGLHASCCDLQTHPVSTCLTGPSRRQRLPRLFADARTLQRHQTAYHDSRVSRVHSLSGRLAPPRVARLSRGGGECWRGGEGRRAGAGRARGGGRLCDVRRAVGAAGLGCQWYSIAGAGLDM